MLISASVSIPRLFAEVACRNLRYSTCLGVRLQRWCNGPCVAQMACMVNVSGDGGDAAPVALGWAVLEVVVPGLVVPASRGAVGLLIGTGLRLDGVDLGDVLDQIGEVVQIGLCDGESALLELIDPEGGGGVGGVVVGHGDVRDGCTAC